MPSPQAFLPSLARREGKVSIDWDDFTKLLYLALQFVPVDEDWYLEEYPDVKAGIEQHSIASAADHYRRSGYLEGRFPVRPVVDEGWYLNMYPDVRDAVERGEVSDARAHYLRTGCREGRMPCPMPVDSTWYEAANPRAALRKSAGESVEPGDDFLRFGFHEGFMPYRPAILSDRADRSA